MIIPTSETMIAPYLRFVAASEEASRSAVTQQVAAHFGLTQEQANGTAFNKRLSWTISYLKTAGFISVAPSTVWTTNTGYGFLEKYQGEENVSRSILAQESPEFAEFLDRSRKEPPIDFFATKHSDTLE